MTLVLETDGTADPSTDASINAVLSTYGFVPRDTPLVMDGHSFSYFHTDAPQDAEAAAQALLLLPGVHAAYLKPEGSPAA